MHENDEIRPLPAACAPHERHLSAYILGGNEELEPEARRALEEHLEGCGRCREELELLKATVAAVSGASPRLEALAAERRSVLLGAAGRAAAAPARSRRGILFVAALAAAALAAAVLAPLYFAPKETPDRLAMGPAAAHRPAPAGPAAGALPLDGRGAEFDDEKRDLTTFFASGLREEKSALGVRVLEREALDALALFENKPSEEGLERQLPNLVAVAGGSAGGLRNKAAQPESTGEGLLPTSTAEIRRDTDLYSFRELAGTAAAAPERSLAAQPPPAGGEKKPLFRAAQGRARAESERPGVAPAAAAPRTADAEKGLPEIQLAKSAAPRDRIPGNPPVEAEARKRAETLAEADARLQIDDILTQLDRRPGETPSMMFFRYWGDNPFVEAAADPLSTFGADVDKASYTLFRAYLMERGLLPPKEAIRTEEFVNSFKSGYAPPAAEGPAFAIHTELAPSPFAHEPQYQILKIGLKGREVSREKRKAYSLVFVVDTSGSMRQGNRIETVREGLRLLTGELDEGDSIGIVAFDQEARLILEPLPASEKERILDAIATLEPRQSTNMDAGLAMGYDMAARAFRKEALNRVILLSDGVPTAGVTDPELISQRVAAHRRKDIYLTCIGVGMGNHNDALLEQLANRSDGQCFYIDRIDEARKVFVEDLTGTLETIARDVKIQVEFDPARVIRYRLLGYENRAIADAAFRDNTVDAGEVGAGHEVTALYELKPVPEAQGRLATVRVRYLTVEEREAVELSHAVESSSARGSFADASPRFQLSVLVAELAEVLRDSYWARGSSLERVASMTQELLGDGPGKLGNDSEVIELAALMKKAATLVRLREGATSDVARAIDTLKENQYLTTQLEEARSSASEEDRSHLEELRQQNQELRRRLEAMLDRR
jgi:Ca-activated chloride channel family protein